MVRINEYLYNSKKTNNDKESKDINENEDRTILEYQIDKFNSSIGTLTDYDCPICKNKGYIEFLKKDQFNKYDIGCKKCACLEKRRIIEKNKRSGLGEYLNRNILDYKLENQWQKSLYHKALQYCEEVKESKKWWVLLGQSGSGKTLLSSIISNYVFKDLDINLLFITWTDFIGRLKRKIMDNNTQDASRLLEEIKNVEALMLDECLKTYNETDLKYWIEIINYRYSNNLITIITSEKTIDDLLKIDEATAGRIIEKSGMFLTNISKDKTKNIRLKNIDDISNI